MRVLFLSPGFPLEMPRFVQGLAAVGAEVVGVGEQPVAQLPSLARESLADYLQLQSLWDESSALERIRELHRKSPFERVECLWEPGVMLAARLRESLELPGMRVEQATAFRDKETMKQCLDRAGIRTPRHRRATAERSCLQAAEEVGFPCIVKPIAGAGSADTHRVESLAELERLMPQIAHLSEVSVEEFIEGEEFTFDTVCAAGEILFYNVSWYRPRPLIARTVEWISPQTVSLRAPDHHPQLRSGLEMGRAVLGALGFEDGFTHMEWFRTETGEAVFGEVAARPPGAISVDVMNLSSGVDTFRGWAEATCFGRMDQAASREYNSAVIFKRAQGQGRIRGIAGLARLVARYRPHIVDVDLLPLGAPRRNWKQTLLSDGHVLVRHPELQAVMEIADRVGTDLQIYAG
jgi:hypothetical protein